MIHIVEQFNKHLYKSQLEQMHKQRAFVFGERLGWDVSVTDDGLEIDEYDHNEAVYLLNLDPTNDSVLGSLRLLPTTCPTLLKDVFYDTMPDGMEFESPTIWECTRFCVDERRLDTPASRARISCVSEELLVGIGEIGCAAGIKTIVGNFVPAMLKLYKRAHCKVDVLGRTDRFGPTVYLGAFHVSEEILENMKSVLGIENPVIENRNGTSYFSTEQAA
ncbi:acyl-homoserine-lactone synthase [Pseudahrensia aquimaris]|uniref:Acyl-homoserine-lactone synthase n=1 Tax=Pseudahrensia aquimaris TaxID=744461 RepID=A0ABW3FHT1_9HYPH